LRSKREAKGISQRELCRIMGRHHNYVSECETIERQLNVIELKEWCEALELDWVEFIEELNTLLERSVTEQQD
jgi:transcriptional regulator with XRE-family HTH domain